MVADQEKAEYWANKAEEALSSNPTRLDVDAAGYYHKAYTLATDPVQKARYYEKFESLVLAASHPMDGSKADEIELSERDTAILPRIGVMTCETPNIQSLPKDDPRLVPRGEPMIVSADHFGGVTNMDVVSSKTGRLPTTKSNLSETITLTSLNSRYDSYAWDVLSSYVEKLPKQPRSPARYKILKDLPTKQEYLLLRNRKYTTDLEGAVEEARSIIEELKEEMESWRDNMSGNNLENTPKYEEVESVASDLGSITIPDDPDDLPGLGVLNLPIWKASRSQRAAQAAGLLSQVADVIRQHYENADGKESDEAEEALHPNREDHESFADELDSVSSEIENLEFPAMF